MRVLVACEFSGRVRDAFIARGHDAISCDLLDSESPGPHIKDDVRNHLKGWDMIIAHPPCQYLCNSGVRWLYKNGEKDEERWQLMKAAAEFFNRLLNAPCSRIAVENSLMHKHANALVDCEYSQAVQPYFFGHPESKAICWWLDGIPHLQPTEMLSSYVKRVHREYGKDKWRARSRTPLGMAKAMAEQWG